MNLDRTLSSPFHLFHHSRQYLKTKFMIYPCLNWTSVDIIRNFWEVYLYPEKKHHSPCEFKKIILVVVGSSRDKTDVMNKKKLIENTNWLIVIAGILEKMSEPLG